jgi:hypothetical protein
MNKLYKLDPEVAGEIGELSRLEYKNGMINSVKFLHYEFYGWLGDELLTSSPCFIVTESLADDIIRHQLTGCRFEEIHQTTSDEFKELYPNKQLPRFVRIILLGKFEVTGEKVNDWSGHDFCIEDEVDLVVTERALNVIKKHQIRNCDIEEMVI